MPSTSIATPHASVASAGRWAKVIDQTQCIGCHACTTACRSENEVPLSVTRTYVKYVDVGTFPQARRAFQVTRCNQCEDPPCVTACPTAAMFARPDGIVDFDKSICIGCKACIAACPYDAIFINPDDHSAEKCNFCAHRLDIGLEPACVVVCPTQAILVGDMDDASSAVSRLIHREATAVRRPEKETRPKLHYRGAHQATLEPLAARRPDGGLYMWSEQGSGAHHVGAGHPYVARGQPYTPPGYPGEDGKGGRGHPAFAGSTSSAAALLSYDIPHRAPWDVRVSLYTWTKSVAAGAYLAAALAAVVGVAAWSDPLWTWIAPGLGLVFLALTGGLLIWDLEHPERFPLLFLRPQWRSWLVRGGFILMGYGGLLVAHMAATWLGRPGWTLILAWAGVPLAVAAGVYTAWLFAQARARDLWQSPLMPPHLLVQAMLAGAGAMALAARAAAAVAGAPVSVTPPVGLASGPAASPPGVVPWLDGLFALAALAHLLMVAGEAALPQVTSHARLAHHELTSGRFGRTFRAGLLLGLVALTTPWLDGSGPGGVGLDLPWLAPVAIVAGLVGLFLFEHAYVQAGQSVPLA